MTPQDIILWRNVAIVGCIVAALWFLSAVLCREWVKADLRKRMCKPLRIRWRPFAWRTNKVTCSFRVIYSDFRGQIHRSICWTYWHRPNVAWGADEIIDCRHETAA
jgi:hypothetical protein